MAHIENAINEFTRYFSQRNEESTFTDEQQEELAEALKRMLNSLELK